MPPLSKKKANVAARKRYLINKLKLHSHMGPVIFKTKKATVSKIGYPHHYLYKLLGLRK